MSKCLTLDATTGENAESENENDSKKVTQQIRKMKIPHIFEKLNKSEFGPYRVSKVLTRRSVSCEAWLLRDPGH